MGVMAEASYMLFLLDQAIDELWDVRTNSGRDPLDRSAMQDVGPTGNRNKNFRFFTILGDELSTGFEASEWNPKWFLVGCDSKCRSAFEMEVRQSVQIKAS